MATIKCKRCGCTVAEDSAFIMDISFACRKYVSGNKIGPSKHISPFLCRGCFEAVSVSMDEIVQATLSAVQNAEVPISKKQI